MPLPHPSAVLRLSTEVQQSDAVIVHDCLYVTSILAVLLAKWHRKQVTVIQHIAAIPFSSAALRTLMVLANKLVTRPLLRIADHRVFISETVRQQLTSASSPLRGELLFNGVDTTVFHPPADARQDNRPRQVLFVGRYVEKKGLTIIRELARRRPDLEFLLVGAGPLKPATWDLANVTDLGTRNSHELAALYRTADLLLLPSVGEGYPLVIQEAMACGLPVVCGEPSNRADPNASQWLQGVVIDLEDTVGSAARCSEAIDLSLLSDADRRAMACYAAEFYQWTNFAARLLKHFQHDRASI
jgi:glycosyltransferase involved in cell wall biosynthesis